jgi:uncharacterized protein (TIRG00374 family)
MSSESEPQDAGERAPASPSAWRRWLPRAIGPVILLVLLARLDIGATWSLLAGARWPLFVVAQLVFVPTLLLRSLRWKLLASGSADMSPGNARMTIGSAIGVYAYAILIGSATPGRVGEFIKVVHLRQQGRAFGAAFIATFTDRLLDLAFLVLVGCGALSALFMPDRTAAWLVAGVLAAFLLIAFFTRGPGAALVSKVIERAVPRALRVRTGETFDSFRQGFVDLTLARLALYFALTLAAWSANYYAVFLLGEALGLDIGYLEMASMAAGGPADASTTVRQMTVAWTTSWSRGGVETRAARSARTASPCSLLAPRSRLAVPKRRRADP